jgi:hypothetical protein
MINNEQQDPMLVQAPFIAIMGFLVASELPAIDATSMAPLPCTGCGVTYVATTRRGPTGVGSCTCGTRGVPSDTTCASFAIHGDEVGAATGCTSVTCGGYIAGSTAAPRLLDHHLRG